RQRVAGVSKKGNNVLYGYRYSRVVLGTWLRERRARRLSGAAGASSADEQVSEPARAAGE
ncbi:hypothetical protein ACOQFL_22880, partial [Actinopolyspora sp. H202]